MIIRKCKSIVKSIENPIDGTFVVTFNPVDKKYKFKPGHFLHLTLEDYDPTMPWPESRCFSIQSPPNKEEIKITFSVQGKYTTRMANEMKEGSEVWLKLPYGELFTEEHNRENCVFIAGGTGVTPYLSLFTADDFKNYSNPKLYLGVRDSSYNLYDNDFNKTKEINPSFKLNVLHQDQDGMLNIETILKENSKESTYFISGPPIMIKNFKEHLIKSDVLNTNIRTDDWE